MVQRDQWDKYWGTKKVISEFAALRPTSHNAAAPAESCQSLPNRSSLGSPRVGTIHVQAPTPHALPLPAYFGHFSHQCSPQNHELLGNGFQSPRWAPSAGVCGAGDYPIPDLPRETSRSRSTPEKSEQFGPDGAPFPSKTSITRGPPVVAVAVSSDPILPQR